MAPRAAGDVEAFMGKLAHERKAEIEELRRAILASTPALSERVKWNAPSFGVDGEDRVTFRLQPGDRVELIFHRGAKKRPDPDSFAFEDPTGLLRWLSSDRGVVVLADAAATRADAAKIQNLVRAWIAATP